MVAPQRRSRCGPCRPGRAGTGRRCQADRKDEGEDGLSLGRGRKLEAGLKVAGSVKGTCWTSSIAVSSSDAYRCMAKSFIYDPCFVPPAKTYTQLACMATPWGKVTLFELTAAMPAIRQASKRKALGVGRRTEQRHTLYHCDRHGGWGSEQSRTELLLRPGNRLGEHSGAREPSRGPLDTQGATPRSPCRPRRSPSPGTDDA